MITRVYIDNFRCFTNFEVRPDRVNLLIGNNGAGKSTFIEILNNVMKLAVLGEAVEQVFPENMRTRWDSRPTQRIELDISANGGTYQYILQLSHDLARETVTLQKEEVKYESRALFLYDDGAVQLHDDDGKLRTQVPFRGTRSFLPQLEPRPENILLTWFLDFLREVWLIKLDPTIIDPESSIESDWLYSDGSNFASWYRHLSQERPEDMPKLFERLGEALPGFRALKTVSAGKGGQKRELVAVFGFGDPELKYEIDFDDLSDGERATIVLYCLLMDAEGKPKTLLLDEPENFVGLQLIQPWLVELADAMRDEGQLFLVSHHPEVIDYLAADRPLLFERPGGGPARVRLDPFDRNEGLKASQLVARGLLDAG
ncbi:MAG: AAA family ATPase [Blastocatellia bacterium]|nr:AAA family ATPase [Blastocatellia bacterium]